MKCASFQTGGRTTRGTRSIELVALRRLAALAGFALLLSGCEALTAPNSGTDRTEVFLARGSSDALLALGTQSMSTSLVTVDPRFSAAAAAGGPVSLANVASINVTITRIEALPAQKDTASEGAWVSLDVASPASVDLLTLPTIADGGIALAGGNLPSGTYGHVRLFVTDASITFKEAVTVGNNVYPANEKITLSIPGAAQTGIKTALSFTVGADGAEVSLLWDTAASISRIAATGAGAVILPPVLGGQARRKGPSGG